MKCSNNLYDTMSYFNNSRHIKISICVRMRFSSLMQCEQSGHIDNADIWTMWTFAYIHF